MTSFWFWYEDVDLAVRLLSRGQGIWDPDAVFRHVGAQSTRSWDKPTQHARLYNGTLRYARKHLSPGGRWLVASITCVACAARVPSTLDQTSNRRGEGYVELARQALRAAGGADPGEAPHPPRRRVS